MKKNLMFIIIILLIFTMTGCRKNSENQVIKKLNNKIEKLNSYKLSGVLEITNNEDTFQYDVNVAYKKGDKYRVSLINKSNNYEQIILKNNDGVYVVTPSLNKSFKFQSEWPNNTSQIYLLHSIIKDIKTDKSKKMEQKDGKYVFTTKVNYPNNSELSTQKITINSDMTIQKIEVLNSDNITQMIMTINNIDNNSNFESNYFDLSSIISKIPNDNNSEENKIDDIQEENDGSITKKDDNSSTEEQTSEINDIIYPLYIPAGTSLSNQEKISTTSGERIILTFDGEKPFLLVEENSNVYSEFNVIPTFGEPFFLTDTIAALTKNSLSWSSNGLDYYIVSDVVSQTELIEIASSITAIPTIK